MAEERDIISSLQFPLAFTLHCPSFPRELTLSAPGEGVLLEFSWAGASLLAGNTLQLGSGEDLVRAHCLVRLRPATEQGLAKLVCVGNRAWNQTPPPVLELSVPGRQDPVFSVSTELLVLGPGEFKPSILSLVCRGLDLLSGYRGSGSDLHLTCCLTC